MAKTRWIGRKKNKLMGCKAPWGDLDVNLLQKIFQWISAEELLWSVSLVCRQWRSICWEILFWSDHETLELSTLKSLVGGPIENFNHPHKLLKALECMMNWVPKMDQEGFPRCVRSVTFAPFMYVRNAHLTFVALRSPKLKRLILPDTHAIETNDVSRAITNWRELEELSIGPIQNARTDHLFRTIGSNCKNFTKLNIFGPLRSRRLGPFRLDDYNASIIAQNMHQLTAFNIDKTIIFEEGVEILLSETKNLEVLNLKLCYGVVEPSFFFFLSDPLKFLKDTLTAKITRKVVNNGTKYWSIPTDSIDTTWTADELVNHLWAE